MTTSNFKTFILVFATLFTMVLTGCEEEPLLPNPDFTMSDEVIADAPRAEDAKIALGNTLAVPVEAAIIMNYSRDGKVTSLTVFNPNSSDFFLIHAEDFMLFWYQNDTIIGKGQTIQAPACGTVRVEVWDRKGAIKAQANTNLGICQVTLDNK